MSFNSDEIRRQMSSPQTGKILPLSTKPRERVTYTTENYGLNLQLIQNLQKQVEDLQKVLKSSSSKYKDVIYRLEAESDLRWCETCDSIIELGGCCECQDEDETGLTNSERNF
ncbi:MAG: hypothetical protein IAF58_04215 [Leptolyngbya sp.]|nr:hypothetical protein [Candidatus Melainabacteria bacterium]